MKKYILIILSLFTIGQQGLSDPMLDEKEILNKTVKQVKISDYKSDFETDIKDLNRQIEKDKTNFKLFYDRGLAYYKYASYLFNIPENYKNEQETKDNSDKYFKLFKLAGDDFEKSISLNDNFPDSYINLSMSLIKVNSSLNKMFLQIDHSFDKNKYMDKLANKRSLSIFGRAELEKMGREYNNLLKNIKGLEQTKELTKKYALENLDKVEELSKDNPYLYNAYAYYYLNDNDNNKAEESIKKSISIDPRNSEFYNTYGLINLNKKDYKAAENNFNTALEISQNNTEYMINLSTVYINNKEIEKTFALLNKGLEIQPSNDIIKNIYLVAFNSFLNTNNKQELLDKLSSSLADKLNQNVFREINSGSYLLVATKESNNDKAIEYIKKALAIEPNNKAKSLLTTKYLSKYKAEKNADNKIKILETALKDIPDNKSLRLEAAKNYKQNKNYDKALSNYKMLVDYDNKNPDYYYQTALLYGLKNDKKNAMDNLNKAIGLDKKYKKISKKESVFRKLK